MTRAQLDRNSPEALAHFRAYARLVSVDPLRNRFRFYSLTWQPMLWGGGALRRTWGRIGVRGRTIETLHPDRESAKDFIEQIIRRRFQHGYHVVDVH